MPANRSQPLKDRIAIVTGASRGAGRGIAVELGAAGATVYRHRAQHARRAGARPTSRSSRCPALAAMPGTIDDTAEEVTARGRPRHRGALRPHRRGRGARRCSSAWSASTAASTCSSTTPGAATRRFDGVFDAPFWEQPLAHWDSMFDRGVRNHLLASRAAAPMLVRAAARPDRHDDVLGPRPLPERQPLLRPREGGDEPPRVRRWPRSCGRTASRRSRVSPGWMRTELVLAGHKTDEAHWQERPALARTESPRYLGRAVAALAADPNVLAQERRVHASATSRASTASPTSTAGSPPPSSSTFEPAPPQRSARVPRRAYRLSASTVRSNKVMRSASTRMRKSSNALARSGQLAAHALEVPAREREEIAGPSADTVADARRRKKPISPMTVCVMMRRTRTRSPLPSVISTTRLPAATDRWCRRARPHDRGFPIRQRPSAPDRR